MNADSLRGNIGKNLSLRNSFLIEDFLHPAKGTTQQILWDESNLACISIPRKDEHFWRHTEESVIQKWIESLRFQSDFTLIDAPPIWASTNMLGLSQMIDATLVIVRNNATPESEIGKIITFLKDHHFPIAGMILNDSKRLQSRYYDYASNSKGIHI